MVRHCSEPQALEKAARACRSPAAAETSPSNICLSVCAEFVTTTANIESTAETKKAKRVRGGGREHTDLQPQCSPAASPKQLPQPLGPICSQLPPSWLSLPPAADQPPGGCNPFKLTYPKSSPALGEPVLPVWYQHTARAQSNSF